MKYLLKSHTFDGLPRADAVAAATTGRPLSINLTEYGAKGDGVTDDTVAIQSAIESGTDPLFAVA